MSGHTPGKWTPFLLSTEGAPSPREGMKTYAAKCVDASPGEDFWIVGVTKADGGYDVCHAGNGPDSAANARLIAAAPDMLDALAALVYWHDRDDRVDGSWWDAAREAVQKASAAASATPPGGERP